MAEALFGGTASDTGFGARGLRAGDYRVLRDTKDLVEGLVIDGLTASTSSHAAHPSGHSIKGTP